MEIKRAQRQAQALKIGLVGPSGSGKTYSGLRIARGLVGAEGKILLVDTEHGSGSLYADESDCAGEYDVIELDSYSPESCIEAIKTAEKEGYHAVVVDSLSHFWMGQDGALEMVDNAARRSKSGNNFTAWRDVTPLHNKMIDTIVGARLHIIATMRAKTEWVLETNDRGKQVPRKIGMAPIQRNGMEYEFTVVGDLDTDHNLVITKSRCPRVDNKVYNKPGEDFSGELLAWMSGAQPAPEKPSASKVGVWKELVQAHGQDTMVAAMKSRGYTNLMEVSEDVLRQIDADLREPEPVDDNVDF